MQYAPATKTSSVAGDAGFPDTWAINPAAGKQNMTADKTELDMVPERGIEPPTY
jgi:hypothetical protein